MKFTEKDLKLFDIIEHKDGTKQMVVDIDGKGLSRLNGDGNGFCEGFGGPFNKTWTYGEIVKVWRSRSRGWFGDFLKDGFKEEYFDLVWQIENTKKMTVKEIQEELGYKIEIVE